MRPTLPLLCRMRVRFYNKDLHETFSWETETALTLQKLASENQDLHVPSVMKLTMPLLLRIHPWKMKIYIYPSVMTTTLPLLCRISPPKIKIYMYLFIIRLNTAFVLQNMPSENKDLYLPFCYRNRQCLSFGEHAL